MICNLHAKLKSCLTACSGQGVLLSLMLFFNLFFLSFFLTCGSERQIFCVTSLIGSIVEGWTRRRLVVYLCSERGVNKLLDERRRFRLRLSWWKLCIEVGEHYFYYVRELGIGKGEPDIGLILIQHLSTQIPHFLLQVSNSYTQIFL